MPFEVRRLTPQDDRSQFRSGNADLDRFFVRYAGQNQFRHHIGTTYIALDESGRIVGYVTVSASEILPDLVQTKKQKRAPRYPLPVLRLARLAVDEGARGKGVGSQLIRAVLVIAQRMSNEVGCVGVVVDSKPESIAFYVKLGFFALVLVAGELGDRPFPQPMFLELGQIPKSNT